MISEEYVDILCKTAMDSVIEKIFPEILSSAYKKSGSVQDVFAEIQKEFPSFDGNFRTLFREICTDDTHLSLQERIVSNYKGFLTATNTGIV